MLSSDLVFSSEERRLKDSNNSFFVNFVSIPPFSIEAFSKTLLDFLNLARAD